ncbi:MAG: transcription termination factor NusA [Candidatus Cloacimonetes bacterium]|nr:transcription termination factor NusA [Candidatus Cloacimonadota bacterium]
MTGNMMAILNDLANLKQLDKVKLAEIIQDSLYQSISKKLVPENELQIIADFKNNRIYARFKKIVVEQDFSLGQISLEDARYYYDGEAEVGSTIPVEMSIQEFEPKVVKIAKRVIHERIKKLEEDRIMFDYEKQKNQIVSGRIRKVDYNGYLIDIGYADALLPTEEQIEDEYYKVGDIVSAYVINIRKNKDDVKIILSRSNPEFVKKLFESEVPEIFAGEIEIKKIVREPGVRTKIAIESKVPKIDAAGSCLGPKGMRIEQIRKELHGEQIDIVVWSDSPELLIANAIGPDLVERVYLAEHGNFARVIVSQGNKNLAIGKVGKNVKLAAKLTDYKIDIFTMEEFEDKIAEERRITSHITDLDGVTPKIAAILKDHGYTSVQDIYEATIEELCNLENIGSKTAAKIYEASKTF